MLPLPTVVALIVGMFLIYNTMSISVVQRRREIGTIRALGAKQKDTRFCLSCHEMQRHGKSLFADNKQALAAAHYQNRLVDRESVCYSCHKDYAMFGDVTAKLNGLRHVWAHYIAGVPKKIELYKPYPNSNCLHCHDDARRFVDGVAHRIAHDMTKVDADDLWQAH